MKRHKRTRIEPFVNSDLSVRANHLFVDQCNQRFGQKCAERGTKRVGALRNDTNILSTGNNDSATRIDLSIDVCSNNSVFQIVGVFKIHLIWPRFDDTLCPAVPCDI